MRNEKIDNLTYISREKSLFYEKFFDWGKYDFSKDLIGRVWFMDKSLISIYGTNEYENLTEFQKKHLSYIEVCQIIYIYTSTEAIMCLFLARLLLQYPIGTSEFSFILREQIEEYRHQDMFDRTLEILKSEHIEFSGFWKYIMKKNALLFSNRYFFVMQIVIEIISGDFGYKCIHNKEVFNLVRDNCKIHEIEETRHIEFAKVMLDNYFKNSGFLARTIGGIIVFFDVIFINTHYIRKENFSKLGIINGKSLYKIAIKNWKKNNIKNFSSNRGIDFLERYGFITWANRWIFKLFLGYK